MATFKNFGIKGVNKELQIGKRGPTLVQEDGFYIAARLKDGVTRTNLRVLDPVVGFDAATKDYVDTQVGAIEEAEVFYVNDLKDVNAGAPADGDVLVYNQGTGFWEAKSGVQRDPLFREATLGTGATQSIGTAVPSSAKVRRVMLNVTTPYSDDATIEVRDDGGNTYMTIDENDAEEAETFVADVPGTLTVGGTGQLEAVVGGSPASGAAEVIVDYRLP